jgi:hypothetical protein
MVHNYYFCSTTGRNFPPTTSTATRNAALQETKAATIASLRRQLQITLMRADLHETVALARASYDPDYPFFPDDVRNGDDGDGDDDDDDDNVFFAGY